MQGAQICGIFAAIIGKGITAELGLRIEFKMIAQHFCLRGQHNRAVMAPRTSKAGRKHRVSSVGCVAALVDKGGKRVKSQLRVRDCLPGARFLGSGYLTRGSWCAQWALLKHLSNPLSDAIRSIRQSLTGHLTASVSRFDETNFRLFLTYKLVPRRW